MAHGLNSVLKRVGCKGETKAGIGSRRIFAPHFKLQVLDSYRNDADCKGNQRATARKYGIHRRQIQKWLQAEGALRSSVGKGERSARPPGAASAPLDCAARPPSPDPAPMDLSLKRPADPPAPLDAWDLSTKRKRDDDEDSAPRPVKLFKPYLDDVDDAPKRHQEVPPCCAAAYYYNNNNVCDASYTLHELQPRSPTEFYYTFPGHYQGAEYEISPFCGAYEDAAAYIQNGAVPLKQRHSYSLDFKLSAIECYYQDSVCKGNQRAVATKYNVHRRQVQKWLKQADELRLKNETIKHTQAVR